MTIPKEKSAERSNDANVSDVESMLNNLFKDITCTIEKDAPKTAKAEIQEAFGLTLGSGTITYSLGGTTYDLYVDKGIELGSGVYIDGKYVGTIASVSNGNQTTISI